MSESLELLAPAADKSVAKAAIDCGADAVYIGAPRFGARVKAGNSVSDIAETVRYAHFYGAKVYVTLNTVLSDAEWPEACRIAWQCHEAGVDAFIIQDMAWLTADNRPPAVWHASTQCDIRTPEKARMLAEAGASRLILARELNLDEIGAIHAAVPVELEAFVHGALCVSYSGQCYMSEYLFGRSGNRGECAQACRLAYDLVNASGKRLKTGLHLLSLKDLALDAYVADMAARGIRSFKIEGRLKDICYVRNVTAHYRRVLDRVMAEAGAAAYRR
ncbi:MAG: U32 family peptidase, partial [Bacteroidales bacterium]|nr:U32 family peptidase [Bacteroidales bacterium]